jgi:transcriptional regulator with XRE-family HTH domain
MTAGKKTKRAIAASDQNVRNAPPGCIICERLRDLREKRGLTQKKLAHETRIHFQTVSRLERVPSRVGTDTLVELAKFFDVPCGYLVGEEKIDIGSQLEGHPDFVAQAARFVELLRVRQAHKPTDLLKVFCAMLEADPTRLAQDKARMVNEEESFGLWWSALAAYERADWDSMILRAEQLKQLGERLGRPFLIAVGRVYKAQALCRRDREVDTATAYRELENVPEDSQLFESALVTRLRAKLLRRCGKVQEALELCEKAVRLMKENPRDDALYRLERTKLLRYLGVLHSRLAGQLEERHSPERTEHMKKAGEYLLKCEAAIEDLRSELHQEANIENMLVAFARACYLEIDERLKESFDAAKQAWNLAKANSEAPYATKVQMFLIHICVLLGYEDEASRHCGNLLPLTQFQTGPFARQYKEWIVPHKDKISEWV